MNFGPTLPVGTRVELHPGLDAWMQGDRYGEVVRLGRGEYRHVRLDRSGRTIRLHSSRLTEVAS